MSGSAADDVHTFESFDKIEGGGSYDELDNSDTITTKPTAGNSGKLKRSNTSGGSKKGNKVSAEVSVVDFD